MDLYFTIYICQEQSEMVCYVCPSKATKNTIRPLLKLSNDKRWKMNSLEVVYVRVKSNKIGFFIILNKLGVFLHHVQNRSFKI